MLKTLLSSGAIIALGQVATPAHAQNDSDAKPPTTQQKGTALINQTGAANAPRTTDGPVPSSDDNGIRDIIVTAERREQNAQRAPLTIQVLTGAELVKEGVTDTQSLQRVTTGVQIGANGGNTQVFVRGVGSFSAGVLTSPGVAFNVDGVYVSQTFGTNGNFYDLARVEVLKGPQGTLYGRNATGGSINLITNQPEIGKRTYDLSLETGNYDYLRATGAVNLPLGDTLAARVSFNLINRKGFLTDGQNDDIEQSARVRVKWQPSDTVSLLLNGDYSHQGGLGGDYVYLPRRPGASPYESNTAPAANAYARTFGPLGPTLLEARPDVVQNTNLYNASAQLDVKLPFATLTVLPAYRHIDADFGVHFNTRLQTLANIDQTTLEARLGNRSRALTWVVGGFYFHEKVDSLTLLSTSIIPALANSNNVVNPLTTSYAAFGQATLSLTDRFRVIGGVRYTNERKLVNGTVTNNITGLLSEAFTGRQTFNNVSYRVGAEFDLAPRSLLYATYSTGYKSGGFSPTAAPNTFGPERLRAAEVGVKNRFLDNRLQLNVSGFYWKYLDIQDSRPALGAAGNLALVTFNSGDATLYGGTVELVARPASGTTISLSGEYNHSKYDNFAYLTPAPFFNPVATGCPSSGPYAPGAALPGSAGGMSRNTGFLPAFYSSCAGFQVARVPKFSGTASIAQDFVLPADRGTITADANLNYSSARWLTIDFIPAERDKAYALLDANLTYTLPDGSVSIGLFGRNLTKSVYYSGAIQSGVQRGLVAANIGAPRTYGVRASFRFGH